MTIERITVIIALLFSFSAAAQNVVFEKFPQKKQIYQRNTLTNSAVVPIRGTVRETSGFERVRLAISDEQGLISETDRFLFFTNGNSTFNFSPQLPAERNNHQFTLLGYRNGDWEMIEAATDVLAGDIFIINGQSNAEAGAAPDLGDVDPYTRSWFSPYDWGTLNLSFPGLWGARLAKVLSEQENLPIAIFNQAQGAVPITTFLPNENDIRLDNYGSLLKRFENANIDKARAALWFHGETDAWNTPTEEYVTNFKKLHDAWVRDYGIERTFLFQMRFRSCQSPNPTILESHRRIGEQVPNTDVLSTLNANHDSCHFYYDNGYKVLAERMAKIMTNRFYGGNDPLAYSPGIASAKLSTTNSRRLELTFKDNQPLRVIGDFPTEDFRLENTPVRITGGRVIGSKVELFLDRELEYSSGVTYLGHPGGAPPGWVTNTAGVGILTFNFFPIDGVEDRGVDLTCYADISVNGLELTVKDFFAPITAVKVLDNSFEAFFNCDQWGGTLCNLTETITLPGPGKYYVRIQTFHDPVTGICDVLQEINVTVTSDPCQNSGGDSDGDGICDDLDCNDFNPNISELGDACNDGNASTINDEIQTDCTCRGTIPPPCFANGGDSDDDGVCADEDCDDSNPNISEPGDACNDGNTNTINDIIQSDCTCRGTIPPPCFANGGDSDGDSVCDDEDCDDTNPNISEPGDACNDGNANTINDEIQNDCACRGTIPPPCFSNGGDSDGDGVCDDEDCDDTNPNISEPGDACNDGNANTINDEIQNDCACRGTIPPPCFSNGGDSDGDGICDDEDCDDTNPNISEPSDACNDGNVNTINDEIQSDCVCRGTIPPPCFANGGDSDGDGVCADEDCDDSDPNIGQLGDACNDGNANTINDQILADCSCAGVLLPPCFDEGGDADGDGVCGAEDCNDANPLVGRPGDSCNDGSASTENDILQADCSCVGTPITPNTGCQVTHVVSGNEILIGNLTAPISYVKIMRSDFTTAFLCTSWDGNCSQNITFQADAPGIFYLQIETHLDWSSPAECMIFEQLEVTDTPILCQNVTGGGVIIGDETICPGDNISRIRSVSLPTGGNGAIEFRWLRSTLGCPNDLSQTIPGETRSSYRPEGLTETTYFRRLSKRADCADWFEGESNCIIKTVESCTPPPPPTGLCNVEFSVSGNELTVTGMTDNIVTLRVSDELLQNDFYVCNDWTTPCDETFVRTFAPGIYYLGVQTFETWEEPLCDILAQFEITATGNRSSNDLKNNQNTTAGTAKIPSEEMVIYPNPASEILNISLPKGLKNEVEIRLTDSFGKTHQTISVEKNSDRLVKMPVQNVSSGIYSVWIYTEGSKPIGKRVLIQKRN